jgi:two-component system OmpR family sensor kinase
LFKTSYAQTIFVATIVLIVGEVLVALGVYRVFYQAELSNLDAALIAIADAESDAVVESHGQSQPELSFQPSPGGTGGRPFSQYVQVLTTKGEIVSTSGNLGTNPLPIDYALVSRVSPRSAERQTVRYRDEFIRVVYFPALDIRGKTAYVIEVATSLTDTFRILHDLTNALLGFGTILVVLSSGGVWLLIKRALRPVGVIVETAKSIAESRTFTRIPGASYRDEVGGLIEVFNKMIDRLEKYFFAQREFTSNVSHELRTPLTILKGNLEVTLRKERTVEELRDALDSNLEEINHLIQIVNDLLLHSKSEIGEMNLDMRAYDAKELVEENVERHKAYAQSKGIIITVDIPEKHFIYVDKDKMYQVLDNLISNAIGYSLPGKTIAIAFNEKDGFSKLTVKDEGIGIDPDDVPHIFERFFRTDRARAMARGTGLGLSITKLIVEAHGGRIDVDSTPNKGTTFTVSLPAEVVASGQQN